MFTFRRNKMHTDYDIDIMAETLQVARKNFLTLNCQKCCTSCPVRMTCIDLNSVVQYLEKLVDHYRPDVENHVEKSKTENSTIVK